MLRLTLKVLKVKPVFGTCREFKHIDVLSTEPVSRFMSEIVTLTENMISVILPTSETITNCRNCSSKL